MIRMARFLLFPYWVLCFVLTHIPNPKHIPAEGGFDKVLHFTGYFILSFLLGSFLASKKKSASSLFQFCFVILLFYGLFDENTQPYFGRDFEWFDLLADLLGTSLGAFMFLKLFPFQSLDRLK